MARRSQGEGTLFKRANGSWTARVTIDGQRLSKTFKLQREANTWLKTITGQVDQGLTFDSSKTGVQSMLENWLSLKGTKLRRSTTDSYSTLARSFIIPKFGHLNMQDLSASMIQAFYHDMEKAGNGRRTIELIHVVMHGFLKHAQRLGLVAQNWADLVEVPRPVKHEMKVWDESQVNQFLNFVDGDVFYRLAFSTGMRRAEMLGLQWKDLDWKTGWIRVQRQVYRPRGGGFIFQAPKTERGKRKIRLGTGILEGLKVQFFQTVPRMQAIAGRYWQENDLIFPSTKGTPKDGDHLLSEFKDLAHKAGLPVIRFHDIRHTAASILLIHGEPPVRVAGILGQSVQILLTTYAHYIPDDQESAASLMDSITTVNAFLAERII